MHNSGALTCSDPSKDQNEVSEGHTFWPVDPATVQLLAENVYRPMNSCNMVWKQIQKGLNWITPHFKDA